MSFVWFAMEYRSPNGRNTRRIGVENYPACGGNGGPVPAQTGRLVTLFGRVDDQGAVVVAHLYHAAVGQQITG